MAEQPSNIDVAAAAQPALAAPSPAACHSSIYTKLVVGATVSLFSFTFISSVVVAASILRAAAALPFTIAGMILWDYFSQHTLPSDVNDIGRTALCLLRASAVGAGLVGVVFAGVATLVAIVCMVWKWTTGEALKDAVRRFTGRARSAAAPGRKKRLGRIFKEAVFMTACFNTGILALRSYYSYYGEDLDLVTSHQLQSTVCTAFGSMVTALLLRTWSSEESGGIKLEGDDALAAVSEDRAVDDIKEASALV